MWAIRLHMTNGKTLATRIRLYLLRRGKKNPKWKILDNELLSPILGSRWYERIINKNGDFSYIINGTVTYWVNKKSSVVEFEYHGQKLVESNTERDHFIVFNFVRGDGTKSMYFTTNWKN